MFRRVVVAACASVCVSACGPEWDTEVEGFVSVNSSMPPSNVDAPVWIHTFITLRNGDELVGLFFDEKTQFLNTGEGGRISWDFNRVYRVRGRKDWIDPAYIPEGGLQIVTHPDATMRLWAFRIERLSEKESQALIDSGRVVRRMISTRRGNPPRAGSASPADRGKPPVYRSEHQARIDSLRAIADNVQERIREIEATQARAAGTHVSEEDQVRLDFAEGELENLRTYLEEIQSRIDAIESRDDRTE